MKQKKTQKLPRPHIMWALYNYRRLMAVEFTRKEFAKIFCGGETELREGIRDGWLQILRVTVSPRPTHPQSARR